LTNIKILGNRNLKAIALFSGGLDSTLAMAVVIEQGVEVIGLNVNIGFGSSRDRREHMESMCKQVGAEFMEVDIRDQFLREILFSPKHGYGKNFNPCIDCHANMFRVAKGFMEKVGASFLISGEVIGQRPMSQNPKALDTVLELGETDELLLRPLSAKLLKETVPEKEGWIDREKLFGISGRGRETQMRLVEKYGILDYESPSGGCLLTDSYFATKIRDFIKYDTLESGDIDILKFGRHFRLKDGAKLVIGRNRDDNSGLESVKSEKFISLEAIGVKSPYALISKSCSEDDLNFSLRTLLSYTKAELDREYEIVIGGEDKRFAKAFESREKAREWTLL
jgi:tRNA-specific 2-thiouridylase